MITGTLIALALILGYLVAVGLSMAVTFGVTKAAPEFVASDHMLKTGYRLFQAVDWTACVIVGSYLSALVASITIRPWFVGGLLAALLVLVLWINTWEVRQRGLGHQLLMSAATVAGVGAGYYLALR
jgi:hypothetical protein